MLYRHQFIIYYILFLSFWFACVFWPLSLPSQIVSIYFAVCSADLNTGPWVLGWIQTKKQKTKQKQQSEGMDSIPFNGDNSFLRFIRVSTCAMRNELNACAPIACAFSWHIRNAMWPTVFFSRPFFFAWFVAFSMHLTRNSTYYFILVALIDFLFAFWLSKNVLFEDEKKADNNFSPKNLPPSINFCGWHHSFSGGHFSMRHFNLAIFETF